MSQLKLKKSPILAQTADMLSFLRGIGVPLFVGILILHSYNTKTLSVVWLWYILFSGLLTDLIDGYLAKKSQQMTQTGWKDIFHDTSMLTATGIYLLLFDYSVYLKAVLAILISVTALLAIRVWRKTKDLEEIPGKRPPIRLGWFRILEAFEMFGIVSSVTAYIIATRIIPNASIPEIFLLADSWLILLGTIIGVMKMPSTLTSEDGALRRAIDDGMSSGDELRSLISWLKEKFHK